MRKPKNANDLALRQLTRAHLWDEQDLVEFCQAFPDLSYFERGEYDRRETLLEEMHRQIIENSLEVFYGEELKLETYKMLMKPHFYLRTSYFIPNMPNEVFTTLWKDPEYKLYQEYASFKKIIENKDIEKLRDYHRENKKPYFTRNQGDSSADQAFFIKSLSLAIELGDSELTTLILTNQNERGFRWRSFEESIFEAIKTVMTTLPAGVFPKVKPSLEPYIKFRPEFETLLNAGQGGLVSHYEILIHDIHRIVKKEFKIYDGSRSSLLDYGHLKSFMDGEIKEEDFFVFGSRDDDFVWVSKEFRDPIVNSYHYLKMGDSNSLSRIWRTISNEQVRHYIDTFVLLYPQISVDFYNLLTSRKMNDTWNINFLARTIECDNLEVFKVIPPSKFNLNLEHAQIALACKSPKILEFLQAKLSPTELTDLLKTKEDLKDIL